MFITKSNVIRGATPSFIEGIGTDLPTNITSPDFSANYTCGASRAVLSFGARSKLSYVAISVSNMGPSGRILARNGENTGGVSSVRGEYNPTIRSHVCMFAFESENFSDLRIVVDTEDASRFPVINYISAGEAIEVPNFGYVGGYTRNSLTQAIKSRTISNQNAAPVANLIQRVPLTGTISLPNMTADFVKGDWFDFQLFATQEPFFIVDNKDNPEESVCGFEPRFSAPKAHAQTRSLENVSIRFKVHNGL